MKRRKSRESAAFFSPLPESLLQKELFHAYEFVYTAVTQALIRR